MEPIPTTNIRHRALLVGSLLAATALAGATTRASRPTAPAPTTPATIQAPGTGPIHFSGQLDRTAVKVGADGTVRMELTIKGDTPATTAAPSRVATDLVVILDRSGSMEGDKIVNARGALRELIGQLGDQDRFQLITYSNEAQVTVPLSTATPAARRGWLATVDGITTDGGTNMSAGLDLALDTVMRQRSADHTPRVILISDGLANQGDATPEGLVARAQRAARAEFALTTVGVGDDFNEYLMTALADAGTGNYYYVQRATDLGQVFAREFGAARATVASALAVEIDPAPGVRVVDAAGYPLETAGTKVSFRPGALFAGQARRVWVTLAVPNQTPGQHALGAFTLAYTDAGVRKSLALPGDLQVACVANDDAFYASIDQPTWERAVTVEEFNKMQDTVARQVKDGRRDEAKATVQEFRERTAAMNARMKSAAVQQKLDGLRAMEAQVDDAFQGADQKAKQNTLSKAGSAAAYDSRRAGSKY